MYAIGAILALLSAATSGYSVVLVRRYSDSSNTFNVSLIITVVGMVVLLPLAAVMTDASAVNFPGFLLFALSGLLSPGLVRLLYYGGMRKLGAAVNSSIFAVYPLYSALFAIVWLSEILTVWNLFGILFILLGIVFVEMSSYRKNGYATSGWKNLVFPVIGGVTLGVSSVVRKYALDVSAAPVFGVAVGYAFSLLPFALVFAFSTSTRRGVNLKRDMRWFWAAGIGQAITWILTFYALSLGTVSVIVPLLSIEPIFVAIFALFYLRKVEQVSSRLFASIAVTVLGVALIAI